MKAFLAGYITMLLIAMLAVSACTNEEVYEVTGKDICRGLREDLRAQQNAMAECVMADNCRATVDDYKTLNELKLEVAVCNL